MSKLERQKKTQVRGNGRTNKCGETRRDARAEEARKDVRAGRQGKMQERGDRGRRNGGRSKIGETGKADLSWEDKFRGD